MSTASPRSEASDAAFAARLRSCALLAAAAVILIPIAALAGWVLEIDALKRVLPDLVAMNPVTACTFLIAGAGLAFAAR
ncbi:MAG: hypothetical protein ABIZ56_12900, partial [Chthoniobacteraceae bacterium]